jgi:hypothetical protein
MKCAFQTFKPEEDVRMGNKEKKTVAQLVTLVMDKIREYPEFDHIAKVAVTRRIPRTSGHANWTVEWSVIGNWSVPEGAYKIVERLCARFDLASSEDLAGYLNRTTAPSSNRANL